MKKRFIYFMKPIGLPPQPRLGDACEAMRRNAPIETVFPELFEQQREAA